MCCIPGEARNPQKQRLYWTNYAYSSTWTQQVPAHSSESFLPVDGTITNPKLHRSCRSRNIPIPSVIYKTVSRHIFSVATMSNFCKGVIDKLLLEKCTQMLHFEHDCLYQSRKLHPSRQPSPSALARCSWRRQGPGSARDSWRPPSEEAERRRKI